MTRQESELRLVFNAFGDDLQPKAVGHGNQRPDTWRSSSSPTA
jgi:hypothetical protein